VLLHSAHSVVTPELVVVGTKDGPLLPLLVGFCSFEPRVGLARTQQLPIQSLGLLL
jgi:hypothetical protein